jgi:hypothetical protein
MGAMALHGYSSMELKRRSFTSKEPHVAREPQVADPWYGTKAKSPCLTKDKERNEKYVQIFLPEPHLAG